MVDTRIWNIIPLAALFVAGCQPGSIIIPVAESETGEGDGDLSDNEGDEFALVDDGGVVRVWGRVP